MTVDVSCREAWRLPVRGARGVPGWGGAWLWRHAATLEVGTHATWAPFELRSPSRLPPAVEARTIAWRYENLLRRRTRHGPDETPLLHEELLPIAGGPPPRTVAPRHPGAAAVSRGRRIGG